MNGDNSPDGLFASIESEDAAPDGVLEKEEIRDFVFDSESVIDVDALEAFITNKKDALIESEEPLHIDISSMMISKKHVAQSKRSQAVKQHMEVEEKEKLQQ